MYNCIYIDFAIDKRERVGSRMNGDIRARFIITLDINNDLELFNTVVTSTVAEEKLTLTLTMAADMTV